MLALKLTLVPLLLIAVTLLERRFGPRVAGLTAGLPLTSGPISLLLALEQGPFFARSAAAGTVAGLSAVCAFCAAYALCAGPASWLGSLAIAFAIFAAASLVLSWLAPGLWLATAFALASVLLALALMPVTRVQRAGARPPAWDLPARVAAATTLALLLTEGAGALGPQITGLLSPFPLFAGVLAAFTHAQNGPASVRLLLRGVIGATPSFVAFFVCIGLGLGWLDVASGYVLAVAATAATQAVASRSWTRAGDS